MALTTQFRQTTLTATANTAVRVNRFGMGVEVVLPPADVLSPGHFSMPQLSDLEQVRGIRPDASYVASVASPAGPAGSVSGTTACRSAVAARAAMPAAPKLRPESPAKRLRRSEWPTGDTATVADLESKLNPNRTSRDCQSRWHGWEHQTDSATVGARAAIAAK